MIYLHTISVLASAGRTHQANERGFGFGSMLGALAITLLLYQGFSGVLADYRATQHVNEAAAHLEKMSAAVTSYLRDNHALYTSSLLLDGPAATISIDTLRDAGYVSPQVVDKNPYGQTYTIRVRYASQGTGATQRAVLEPLILTEGGAAISDRELLRIAGKVDAGGMIRSDDPSRVVGTNGGWEAPLAAFGGTPGAGHLAAGLFYSDAGMLEDYLYRHAVPGQPELNRMDTDLDMAGNAIKLTAANGQSVWMHGATGRLSWTDRSTAKELASLDATTGSFRAGGRLASGEHLQLDGIAVEGEACEPAGLIGRDEDGLILSCQSGVWRIGTMPGNGGYNFKVSGSNHLLLGVGTLHSGSQIFDGIISCDPKTYGTNCGREGRMWCGDIPSCVASWAGHGLVGNSWLVIAIGLPVSASKKLW